MTCTDIILTLTLLIELRPSLSVLQMLSHLHLKVYIYERVAVGRKYPCSRPLWICLLWLLLQSLFHVQLGWNFNTKQPLYVQPFCLWPDENPLAWSGAIHHQKKAIILAVNCQSHQYFAHYLVSKVLFKAFITSAGIILPSYETMQPI